MLKTVRCHVTVRMVGFLEGVVTEGWVGTLQATLGPIGLLVGDCTFLGASPVLESM